MRYNRKWNLAIIATCLIIGALYSTTVFAQQKPSRVAVAPKSTPEKAKKVVEPSLNKSIQVAYFGESVYHPGLKLAFEYVLIDKVSRRSVRKNTRTKVINRQIFVNGHMAGFYHPNNSSVLLLGSEIGYRKIKTKGWQKSIGVGLAYAHTFLDHPTYTLDETNTIEQIPAAGQSGMAAMASVSFGRDLWKPKQIPVAWYIKPMVLIQTPYNHVAALRLIGEVGISYKWQ